MQGLIVSYSKSPDLATSFVSVGVLHALGMSDEVEEAYLWAKELDDKEFDFALVTGIGDVTPKVLVKISPAKVIPLKTTLCGLERIKKKYPGKYVVIQDVVATNKSEAAKVIYKLVKGRLDILDL